MLTSYVYDSGVNCTHLVILGAIHGNEICGPNAIKKIMDELDAGKHKLVKGKVTLVPVCNPVAYAKNVRFVEENLNRIIRKHENPQNNEQRYANEVCGFIENADVMLDLHSFEAEGNPMIFLDHPTAKMSQLADRLGAELILYGWDNIYKGQPISADTTETWAHKVSTEGLTFECGQNGREESDENAYTAILRTLSFLGFVDSAPTSTTVKAHHVDMDAVILKERAGDFARTFKDVEFLQAGTLIAQYNDGETLSMPYDGYIVLPKPTTPIGQEWYYIGRERCL